MTESEVEAWIQEKGNISKEAFCKKNKLSQATLSYWLTQYNKEFKSASKREQALFVPVKIKEEPESTNDISHSNVTPDLNKSNLMH